MKPVEDYQDFLETIETAVVRLWRGHPEMTNYTAMRAYEAAMAHYKALAREQVPKPVNLTGLDADVFQAVQRACEARLGRGPESGELPPIPLEDLLACLRKLQKSVDFWTKEGGRQGYLQFVQKFVR